MDADVIAMLLREMLVEWSAASPSERNLAIRQLHRLTNGPKPDDGTLRREEQAAIYGHLTRLIAMIENPRQWTSKAFARDENGHEVPWSSPSATSWDVPASPQMTSRLAL
jgi:hypothetical protein